MTAKKTTKTTVEKNPKPRQTPTQRSLGKVFKEFARLNQQTVKLADALAVHMRSRDDD